MMPPDAQRLQHYFGQSADAARITNFRDITSGWQTAVYAFTLETGSEQRDLVLRLYPGGRAAENAQREFDGIRQLHAAGYPVPAVVVLETDSAWFGQPFIVMVQKATNSPAANSIKRLRVSAKPRFS